jgi:pimeloyl-ACP methyl ester carboxylesterase
LGAANGKRHRKTAIHIRARRRDARMATGAVMEAEINGVRLTYVEQGAGEPMVFVHGLVSDLRIWQPIKDEIAKKYRFIAYAQRYFGTGPWNDDGELFSVGTLSNDLVKFIDPTARHCRVQEGS